MNPPNEPAEDTTGGRWLIAVMFWEGTYGQKRRPQTRVRRRRGVLLQGGGASGNDVSGRNISAEEAAANTGVVTRRSAAKKEGGVWLLAVMFRE